MTPTITQETLQLMEEALHNRTVMPDITRAITQTSGYIGYYLETPAKAIVPVQTPLVNMLPRKAGTGIDIEHWKAITSFDTGRVNGALDGANTPQAVAPNITSMQNYVFPIALSNAVTFTAQVFGRSLQGDLRAMAMAQLLYQLKIVEERWIIGASYNLMVPPAPIVAQTSSTSGHASDATTYYVAVTACNATNVETTMSNVTAFTTPANSGLNTGNLVITLFTVPFAAYYNVYVGTVNARASLWRQTSISGSGNAAQPGFQAAVSLKSGGSTVSGEVQGPTLVETLTAVILTSGNNPPATNTAYTSQDSSNNPNMWDGLIAQALNNSSGTLGLGSQAVEATGVLTLGTIDNMLVSMYNQAAADPDCLIMNSIVHRKLTNLVANANQTRYVVESTNGAAQGQLTAQYRVTHYLNEATGKMIPIVVDRYCPADTIVALPLSIPYPVPQVSNAVEVSVSQEYWGVDYAITSSQFQFADYVYETLKVYFLAGLGVIRGILPDF